MRNTERVVAQRMINAVSFRDRSILIEQKRKRDRMCAEILRRFPDAIALFGRNVDKVFYFLLEWLKLSQALAAVGSPGAPGEFDH